MNRQNNWFQIARAVKRALAGSRHTVLLQGQPYHVAYEARRIGDDRDYAILWQLAQKKKCVFDVGANLGATALLMSSAVAPTGKIYAFEASETACHLIEKNVRLNALTDQIQVVNAVLMDSSGCVVDFYGEAASGGASTIAGYLGHDVPMQKVSLALDDFAAQKGVWPDLVKIDVEGAELLVLQGMRRILREGRPSIFVELHSWQEMTIVRNAGHILSYLAPVNYQMIYLRQKVIVQDPAILAGRGRCHVLLLPQEQSPPDWLQNFDTSAL